MLLPLLACAPVEKAPRFEGAAETGGDSAAPDDTGASEETGPPPDGVLTPLVGAPFVLEGCGADDGDVRGFGLVDDRDGDGLADLLVALPELRYEGGAGFAALVGSATGSLVAWEAEATWRPEQAYAAVQAVPDRDGDGLAELVVRRGTGGGYRLAPDGTVETWEGLPWTVLPWHDLDGDGADDWITAEASLYDAEHMYPPGAVRVLADAALTEAAPTVLAELADDTRSRLGVGLALTAEDHDGDGFPDLLVTDARDGWLLGSAAIDAGATLAEATLRTFEDVGDATPRPLGDVDGGGVEDFAFVSDGALVLARGEGGEPVSWFDHDFGGTGMGLGPDGAGGVAVWTWTDEDPTLRAWDLAAALAGGETLLAEAPAPGSVTGVLADADQLWVLARNDRASWITEPAAWRIDPAAPEGVLATVTAGGFGGWPDGSVLLRDRDGDGTVDWNRFDDVLWSGPLAAGTTASMCDGSRDEHPDWESASVVGDLDGDGLTELAYGGDDRTLGIWSPADGVRYEDDVDGFLVALGCDLTGDGAQEVYAWPDDVVYDAAALVAGTGAWQARVLTNADSPSCAGDLDGDGYEDAGVARSGTYYVYRGANLAGVGDGAGPATLVETETERVWSARRLGDLHGDGFDDLAVRIDDSEDVNDRVCVVSGEALFAAGELSLGAILEPCWQGVTVLGGADTEGDGYAELVYDDGAVVWAWSPYAAEPAVLWDLAADAWEAEPVTLVPDAFGPGVAGLVLGDHVASAPVVVVPLGG